MRKYAKAIVLRVVFLMFSNYAMAQSSSEVVPSLVQEAYQQLEYDESVPPGNSVRIMSSFVPLGDYPNYFSGKIIFNYNGFISVGVSHDDSFGNPLHRMILANLFEFRFQILEERGSFPAVSLFYKRTIDKQDLYYSGNNIWSDNHSIYSTGLAPRFYNADNSLFSIGLSSKISKKLNMSWSLGVREFVLKEVNNPQSTLSEQTTFRIHWSASGSYMVTEDVRVFASTQTIPLWENDFGSYLLISKVGNRSMFGIRYFLMQSVNIELFDHVITGFSTVSSYHYIRVGFNAALSFY